MTNVDVHAQSVRKWLHCDIALGLNKLASPLQGIMKLVIQIVQNVPLLIHSVHGYISCTFKLL